MANKIIQYRYYGEGNDNNTEGITRAVLISGAAFSDSTPIVQLGVQTMPGTMFYVNKSPEPIIVGSTGIYELDVSTGTYITDLRFDYESIDSINADGTGTNYLLVDIVYEVEED